ncbi:helix-turn-helix domain-containing protein [Sungkyunkwania multivorans]|uniref:Helix-turn-helix domain-containing protein n=1 Tax=Sungkyunkwania multivorans TaxID=1173618 RepID=A0ABW3CYJ1_9FLAO
MMMIQRTHVFVSILLFLLLVIHPEGSSGQTSTNPRSTDELIAMIKESSSERSKALENELIDGTTSQHELAQAYFDLGDAYYVKNDFQRAEYYLTKGISLAQLAKDMTLLCNLHLKRGNIYLKDWNNQSALDEYHMAMDYAKKIDRKDREVIASINIAIIRRRMKQFSRALEVCKSGYSLIDEGQPNYINLLTITSDVYLDLEQPDSASQYVDKGIVLSEKMNYKAGLVDLFIKKAIILCLKKKHDEALTYLDDTEQMILEDSARSNKDMSYLRYAQARCFYEKGAYETSIGYLTDVLSFTGEDKDIRNSRVIDAHLLLIENYKKIGDVDKTIDWYDKYIVLNRQSQRNRDQTVDKLNEKDLQIRDSEIEALKKDRAKRKKVNLYTIISFSVILLALIIFFIIYRKKQRANKVLFDELIAKMALLESAEENEGVGTTGSDASKEIVIDDEKVNEVLKGLQRLESQEYFLSSACNLRSIAKKVKTNTTYLSKIINNHKGKNFNDYINDLRIDYTLKRLKNDKQFRSFSIKSIATEVGYKSDYSFTKHFKSKTGLNPSYYIRNIDKLGAKNT